LGVDRKECSGKLYLLDFSFVSWPSAYIVDPAESTWISHGCIRLASFFRRRREPVVSPCKRHSIERGSIEPRCYGRLRLNLWPMLTVDIALLQNRADRYLHTPRPMVLQRL